MCSERKFSDNNKIVKFIIDRLLGSYNPKNEDTYYLKNSILQGIFYEKNSKNNFYFNYFIYIGDKCLFNNRE